MIVPSNHPLPRGVNISVTFLKYPVNDSSPLARGKQPDFFFSCVCRRFIPSCDGQTMAKALKVSRPTIHPLLRGADVLHTTGALRPGDSSPPARGQTHLAKSLFLEFVVHPLPRGADFSTLSWISTYFDSSPHTRGKRQDGDTVSPTIRFIPSYEGQTRARAMALHISPIHPLIRGANPISMTICQCLGDSSPHTRGKLVIFARSLKYPRFIPSYEGQTSVFMRLSAALNTSLCNLHKCHFQLITHHFLYI